MQHIKKENLVNSYSSFFKQRHIKHIEAYTFQSHIGLYSKSVNAEKEFCEHKKNLSVFILLNILFWRKMQFSSIKWSNIKNKNGAEKISLFWLGGDWTFGILPRSRIWWGRLGNLRSATTKSYQGNWICHRKSQFWQNSWCHFFGFLHWKINISMEYAKFSFKDIIYH